MASVQCLALEVLSCQLPGGRLGYKGKEHLTLCRFLYFFPLNISLLASVRERILGWQTSSRICIDVYVLAWGQTCNTV